MENINKNFYDNLNQLLKQTSDWPCEYLFKFIVKSDEKKIKIIESIFDNIEKRGLSNSSCQILYYLVKNC